MQKLILTVMVLGGPVGLVLTIVQGGLPRPQGGMPWHQVALGWLLYAVLWLVWWRVVTWASVWAGEDGLLVRVLWRKKVVPYGRITDVKSSCGICLFVTVLPIIVVHYRDSNGAVKKVRFVGRYMRGLFRGTHPDVVWLWSRARYDGLSKG